MSDTSPLNHELDQIGDADDGKLPTSPLKPESDLIGDADDGELPTPPPSSSQSSSDGESMDHANTDTTVDAATALDDANYFWDGAGDDDDDETDPDYYVDDESSYYDPYADNYPFDISDGGSNLQQGIIDNEASLVAARADRQALTMNQQIRRDQDEAYQESLKADQEKERKRKAEQEKRDAEEKVLKDKKDAEQQLRDRLLKLKVDLADRIPVEPAVGDANLIRLLVKLPNGTRLERRFTRSTSLKALAYFVFCQAQSPVSFQITTNFPRKELPCVPPTLDNQDCTIKDETTGTVTDPPTFEEFGLGTSEMLFVHDLEA